MKTGLIGIMCLTLAMVSLAATVPEDLTAVPVGGEPFEIQPVSRSNIDFNPMSRDYGIHGACDRIFNSLCPAACGGMGIPWEIPPCPPPANVFGTIFAPAGIGMLLGYTATGDPNHVLAVLELGDFGLCYSYPTGEFRFGSHTPHFLWKITEMIPGSPSYRNHAQTAYIDALHAGTYGTGPWDTAGHLTDIWNARPDTQRNIRSYDLANLTHAFREMGHPGQFDLAVNQVMAAFDNCRAGAGLAWEVLGPAAGIFSLGLVTIDYSSQDPDSPMFGQPDLFACVEYLLNAQTPCGGFSHLWNWADYYPASSAEYLSKRQVSAYALLAMKAVDPWYFSDEIQKCEEFLHSRQLPDGGFADALATGGLDPSTEKMQTNGEVIGALLFEADPWNDGDVDNNNTHTPGDAQAAFQICLGLPPYENPRFWTYNSADCNGDGSVTPGDAQCIWSQYLSPGSCLCADPIQIIADKKTARPKLKIIASGDKPDGELFTQSQISKGVLTFDIFMDAQRPVTAFGFKIKLPGNMDFIHFDFSPKVSDWEFSGSHSDDKSVAVGAFDINHSIEGRHLVGTLTAFTYSDSPPTGPVIHSLVDDIAGFVIK